VRNDSPGTSFGGRVKNERFETAQISAAAVTISSLKPMMLQRRRSYGKHASNYVASIARLAAERPSPGW
jgi:hypothetical protein